MATDIMAFVKFSDGTMGSFLKEGATAETVTTVPTGGNGINQVSGVEIGQAYAGKTAVAAQVICATDSALTAAFSYGYLLDPQGKIITLVQGGGQHCTGMPRLPKPVRMEPGITLNACVDAVADAVALASLGVCYTDGSADCYFIKAVADTATELVNKDGNGIGKSGVGKVIKYAYATYSATNGLNDDGGGFGSFYVQSADGQLKMCFPPGQGKGQGLADSAPFIPGYGTRIEQNDVLYVNAGV